MSEHYDKFSLNTYPGTPYFQAHIPPDYPLSLVLQKSRAFRRLPPRLRELSEKSKEWAVSNHSPLVDPSYYDDEGYELNSETRKRLTDEDIDAEWDDLEALWGKPDGEVEDIPAPEGGFPDPDTWEEPEPEEEEEDRPSEEQVLSDIKDRGRERAAQEYGVPQEVAARAETDEELAGIIAAGRGGH